MRHRSSTVFGGAAVQPGVDLRAATGAAALGVGDRRATEGRGHAAGAVLPIHLLERERHDLALAHERALLDDDDVETGLGEQRCRRRAAGTGTDDEHVGVRRQAIDVGSGGAVVTGRSVGCGRRPRLPHVGVRQRAHEADVVADHGQRAGGEQAGDAARGRRGVRRRRRRRRRRRPRSASARAARRSGARRTRRPSWRALGGQGGQVDGEQAIGELLDEAGERDRPQVRGSRRRHVSGTGSRPTAGLRIGRYVAEPWRPSMTSLRGTVARRGAPDPRARLARPRRPRRRRLRGPRRRVDDAVGGGRTRHRPPHVGGGRAAAAGARATVTT